MDTSLQYGPALAPCVGKHLVPKGNGATHKHDDQGQGEQRDDELRLPEPQHVVEYKGAQAEHCDNRAKHTSDPDVGRERASDIAVLVGEGAGLGEGQDLCCPTHDEDEAEREEPATQTIAHEVGHKELAREKGERDERIEQGRHPHKHQHLHQVLVPHGEKAYKGGDCQQPIRRIELGVVGLDAHHERRECNALNDTRERQVGRANWPLRRWETVSGAGFMSICCILPRAGACSLSPYLKEQPVNLRLSYHNRGYQTQARSGNEGNPSTEQRHA